MRVMALAAVLGTALCASCAGGASVTTSFKPSGTDSSNNPVPSTPVSGSDQTVVVGGGGGGSDTDLNLPGSGGADHGASYLPAITVPVVESFSNDAAPGTDDVDAWLIN
ncbi:MAG: hypothetical protein M3R04_00710, partial [bacterium]|nr:hypothetical protein [bacterium]